jgi:orsellinic acid C2-O-methyltransferase
MSDDPVTDVMWMVRGAWVTMSIRAGCRLGVFDHLVEPRSTAWLAAATSSDPGALTRLLRALTEVGLLEARDADTYVDTDLGSTLTTDHPGSLRSLALMQSWLPNVATWNHLDDAVRSGAGVYERVNGADPWEHLGAHPDQEAWFNRSMARRADGQVAAIVAGIDLAETETVVDVGGGRGAMLAGVLRAWPRLTGVVADRPEVAAEADAAFAEAGLIDRAHGVGTDFFASVPSGADVYFLANVLHDWDDDDCLRILRTVRSAMDAESRLVVVERLLGVPGRSPTEARDLAFVDLHMLVMFGARERTMAEYDALLTGAGFRPGELIGPAMSWNLVETRPADSPTSRPRDH